MNSEFEKYIKKIKPIKINKKKTHTTLSCSGGCEFVIDPEKPHLGGNLEGGDSGTAYPNTLWPWLIEKFSPKSILDVGCAEGHAIEWFSRYTINIIGIDGLKRNIDICRNKKLNCIEHDLYDGPFILENTDMIWCSDVIEHIEEKYLCNIFKTFRCGKILVISHGLEDNETTGWHHVTNKSNDWWIQKFESEGFKHDKDLSQISRDICLTGWYKISGKIFFRE